MSRYKNAADVLPAPLLAWLQKYAEGEVLYIPRSEKRLGWGERSGAREALHRRNEEIRRRRLDGASVEELMEEFHLGYDSIRKILSGKNGSTRSRGCDETPLAVS